MSICSTIGITKEEAKERVKKVLLYEQERLINLAIKSMNDYELTGVISDEMNSYYIKKETKEKK